MTTCLRIISLLVSFLNRSLGQFPGIVTAVNFVVSADAMSFFCNGCTRLQPRISGVQVLVTADIGELVCRRLSLPNIVGIVWSIATVSHHARMHAVLLSFLPAASYFGVQVFVVLDVGGAWLNAVFSERRYSGSTDSSPPLGVLLPQRYTRTAAEVHCKRCAISSFWLRVSYSHIDASRALHRL